MNGAKEVVVWGTGAPMREFLTADDLGDACIFVMKYYSDEDFLNVGIGQEVSIRDFAELVARSLDFAENLCLIRAVRMVRLASGSIFPG